MAKKQAVFARYVGDQFIVGVPAKDMTKKEWMKLSEEKREKALHVGTHKLVASKQSDAPIEPDKEEVNDG